MVSRWRKRSLSRSSSPQSSEEESIKLSSQTASNFKPIKPSYLSKAYLNGKTSNFYNISNNLANKISVDSSERSEKKTKKSEKSESSDSPLKKSGSGTPSPFFRKNSRKSNKELGKLESEGLSSVMKSLNFLPKNKQSSYYMEEEGKRLEEEGRRREEEEGKKKEEERRRRNEHERGRREDGRGREEEEREKEEEGKWKKEENKREERRRREEDGKMEEEEEKKDTAGKKKKELISRMIGEDFSSISGFCEKIKDL